MVYKIKDKGQYKMAENKKPTMEEIVRALMVMCPDKTYEELMEEQKRSGGFIEGSESVEWIQFPKGIKRLTIESGAANSKGMQFTDLCEELGIDKSFKRGNMYLGVEFAYDMDQDGKKIGMNVEKTDMGTLIGKKANIVVQRRLFYRGRKSKWLEKEGKFSQEVGQTSVITNYVPNKYDSSDKLFDRWTGHNISYFDNELAEMYPDDVVTKDNGFTYVSGSKDERVKGRYLYIGLIEVDGVWEPFYYESADYMKPKPDTLQGILDRRIASLQTDVIGIKTVADGTFFSLEANVVGSFGIAEFKENEEAIKTIMNSTKEMITSQEEYFKVKNGQEDLQDSNGVDTYDSEVEVEDELYQDGIIEEEIQF